MNVLYRFYNSRGQLLYVGITNNPTARFRDHMSGKKWWPTVVQITLRYFWDRDELVRAEKRAIEAERPLHNIAHNHLIGSDQIERCRSTPDGSCPTCGRDVIYSRAFDLLFHVDGSDNVPCWVQIRRGAVEYTGRTDR